MKYYSLNNILKKNATYNVIFGERSNGKTFAVLKYALENYINNGRQLALVRRWQDDFTGKRGATMFDSIVSAGLVTKLTKGEWSNIFYYSSRWYLCRYEDDKRILDDRPLAYGFSISSMEHDKSTSYPDIDIILFDECITRSGRGYLTDEFTLFMNVVSTIVRQRDDVKIFLCGNTVNRFCPLFDEMGLKHIKDQKQGTIDVYTYGDSKLTVAVEYCSSLNKQGKPSDKYFAFDNPKLAMITGGAWEIAMYDRCPIKFQPKDIVFSYFIEFSGEWLQGDIVLKDNHYFTFVHKKTSELKNPDKDIVFSPNNDSRPNYIRRITKPYNEMTKKIWSFYAKDKIFYDTNETGEVMRNYLQWCGKLM